jgi:hypothetical protein
MKRDTVKTLAGLAIIGGIVVATFLYGNSQRQAQLSHDQQVKQQEAKTQQAKTAQPSATAAAGNQAANNTAPVKSPSSNTIQGSTAQTPTSSPAATPAPAVAGTAVTPITGGSGLSAPLPSTGPEMAGMLGLGSITTMLIAVRGSRRAMLKAARTRR